MIDVCFLNLFTKIQNFLVGKIEMQFFIKFLQYIVGGNENFSYLCKRKRFPKTGNFFAEEKEKVFQNG